MKVIFWGTPLFSAEILIYLLDQGVDFLAVVTQPDRPKGRSSSPSPSPVKEAIQSRRPEVPILQPEKVSDLNFIKEISGFQSDLFVVAAFGEIIKEELLRMPVMGAINVHTSLLPKYRGAAPIQRCIMDGEKETGVTIMHMVKKLDAGNIIKVAKTSIGENMNFGELEEILCRIGSKCLYQTLCDFEEYGSLKGKEQDHDRATYAKKIETSDCEVVWRRSALGIHNQVRAVTPRPGAWCNVTLKNMKKRLKIKQTFVIPDRGGGAGEILDYKKDGIVVACGEGSLVIKSLQLEGKKLMQSDEFVCGVKKEDLSFL